MRGRGGGGVGGCSFLLSVRRNESLLLLVREGVCLFIEPQ